MSTTTPPARKFLTIDEVAEALSVSTRTVRTWIAEGDIEARRLPGGRLIRIPSSELDRLGTPLAVAR